MLINIKGKNYEFRYGWGALYMFETAVPNRQFNPKRHADLHFMYFCILTNSNKNFDLTQDDFIEAMDTQQGLTAELNEAFAAELKRWSELQGPAKDKKKEENL